VGRLGREAIDAIQMLIPNVQYALVVVGDSGAADTNSYEFQQRDLHRDLLGPPPDVIAHICVDMQAPRVVVLANFGLDDDVRAAVHILASLGGMAPSLGILGIPSADPAEGSGGERALAELERIHESLPARVLKATIVRVLEGEAPPHRDPKVVRKYHVERMAQRSFRWLSHGRQM
jgi:hypothetical protein